MMRLNLTLRSLLLGSLLASQPAIGQEPVKEFPPADQATVPAVLPKAKAEAVVGELDEVLTDLRSRYPHSGVKAFDALEVNFGLGLADADDALRAQLEIPQGHGVVVVGVKSGSLAEHAGLKRNDVLLKLGGQEAQSWGQVKQILLGLGKEALEVKLIREGKPRRMSLVGPEHGFLPEAAEYWIGTPVSTVDATLRAHLPDLAADSGLIVNDVVKGSPADQVGVIKNDILVSMDGKPLKNADSLIAQIQASQGKPVPLQVFRAGKPITLTITPARRAHPTVINLRRAPRANQFTVDVVRPGMAIEVAPRNPIALPGQRSDQGKEFELAPGSYTLYAPYTGILRNPYADLQGVPANPNQALAFQPYLPLQNLNVDATQATAGIEGQLKEIAAKLDEITKALEALKKVAGK